MTSRERAAQVAEQIGNLCRRAGVNVDAVDYTRSAQLRQAVEAVILAALEAKPSPEDEHPEYSGQGGTRYDGGR